MNVILEFNGIPAIGKSTIANKLSQSLKDSGIRCCSSFRGHSRYINYLEMLCNISCWEVFFTSLRFTLSVKPQCQALYRSRKFVLLYKMYNDFLKNNDDIILIMDQGVLQNTLSAINLGTMSNTRYLLKLIQFFSAKGISFIRIDCNADIETVLSRLTNRKHGSSRFDGISDGSAKQKLAYQKEQLDCVRSFFSQIYSKDSVIQLDTCDTIEHNVSVITNQLF